MGRCGWRADVETEAGVVLVNNGGYLGAHRTRMDDVTAESESGWKGI